MAAPERWWVVGAAAPRQPLRWKVVESPSKPAGDFVDGPYPTKAAAEAKLKSRTSPITPPKIPVPKIPNPLSGIGAVGHWLGKAVLAITDLAMWRSLAWLALGMMLVIGGIYLWFRTSATYQNLEAAAIGAVKAL